MKQTYRVRWEIEIISTAPEDAATQALLIQRDPESIATVFSVTDEFNRVVTVDLSSRSHDL